MRALRSHSGFTLIELLVVIAIIGVLSAVVVGSLSIARAKARDASRLSDLKELRTALELYALANNGYPNTSSAWWGSCSNFGSHGTTGANGWIPNLAPTYISELPLDPKPVGTTGCYIYRSDGQDLMILAYGTVETYTASNNPAPRPTVPTHNSFSTYTSGAASW